jgi:hypothetical protein
MAILVLPDHFPILSAFSQAAFSLKLGPDKIYARPNNTFKIASDARKFLRIKVERRYGRKRAAIRPAEEHTFTPTARSHHHQL